MNRNIDREHKKHSVRGSGYYKDAQMRILLKHNEDSNLPACGGIRVFAIQVQSRNHIR